MIYIKRMAQFYSYRSKLTNLNILDDYLNPILYVQYIWQKLRRKEERIKCLHSSKERSAEKYAVGLKSISTSNCTSSFYL